MYYRNAEAAMAVYDITSRHSFQAIQSWVAGIVRNMTFYVLCSHTYPL